MHARFRRPLSLLTLSIAALLPLGAQAHRAWLLPSATVFSGSDAWVTVDAAISNDLFYFEHQPMRLDGLVITAPDGSVGKAENLATGRYRSVFDLRLTQVGTYRIAVVNRGMFASFKLGTETKRLRGTAESLAREIPAEAKDLNVTQNFSRIETFVTSGKPSTKALETSGEGLEMLPITHPNDIVVGSPSRLRFLLDGKPAADLEINVIPGGIRYRDKLNEIHLKTDAKGEVTVNWAVPGPHWIEAEPPRPAAQAGGARAVGSLAAPLRRVGYAATLEVLPQ